MHPPLHRRTSDQTMDEFVILMPDTALDVSERAAHRIQAAFTDWCTGHGYPCSATIGTGEAPRDGHSLEAILEKVDAALYYSKANEQGGLHRVDQLPANTGARP